MVSLLWDGITLFQKNNQIVTTPGHCCNCEETCPTPSGCSSVIWVQCSGDNCCDYNFSNCLIEITQEELIDQGYSIPNSGEPCCRCDGIYFKDIYACCSGVIDTSGENDLLIPANIQNDCILCSGISGIILEQIDQDYFWRIPQCVTGYYCILEE